MTKNNAIKEKSYAFALRVVKLHKHLSNQKNEDALSQQVLRSGTAIGALVREAEYAENKADFTHTLANALKEAHKTDYWLDLLFHADYLAEKSYQSIHADIEELLKLLTAIVKSSKNDK